MFSLLFFLPENDAEKCFALLPFLPARTGMATTPQNDSITCTLVALSGYPERAREAKGGTYSTVTSKMLA